MKFEKSDILILLPAYNEASVIGGIVTSIRKEGYTNICVINDGSSDHTFQEGFNAGAVILTHPVNRGAGAAIQTGLSYAEIKNYQYVVMMDSDGQHLPEDIKLLFAKMKSSSADIVIGNRFLNKKNAIPRHRISYNVLANFFTNLFCKQRYKDTQSGFRLLNRNAIENLKLKNRGFGFCSEMLIFAEQSGLKVEETPIQVIYSDYSMSKGQNLFVGFKTAMDIIWRVVFN